MSKKAENGAGTLERRGAVWWIRLPVPNTKPLERRRVFIPDSERMTRGQAKRAGAEIAADVRVGRKVFDPLPRRGAAPAAVVRMTVRQLGDAWTTGELYEKHGAVNRLRVKATADIDTWTMAKHVYPVKTRGPGGPDFGDLAVNDVTTDDIAAVMGAHGKELAAQTRMHTYQRLSRLFDLAIFPCKLLKDSPVTRYLRPQRDPEKLFCFLYPTEMIALLRGTDVDGKTVVPLGRRVLYAIATFTGQRKGSLYALRWKHVDFDHGTLASFKTKTGRAQYFVADRGLIEVLRAWHAHKGAPDDEQPIVSDLDVDYDRKRLATALRDDLKAVGVGRSLLYVEDAPNVEPLRFHDLRSTFCTWARRAGKSDAWISERTGHELSGDMISRYDRGATTLEDLAYEPFPDIAHAVPEFAPLSQPLAKVSGEGPGGSGEKPGVSATYQSGREDLNLRLLGPEAREGGSTGIQERGITSGVGPVSIPVSAPRDELANALANAIDRLTARLATASDDEIGGLVSERAAMRAELRGLRESNAGNVVSFRRAP